ncbi:MAG TPA: tetratricopeptide repeat protein [Polyangiaceae bacterium]|nr:tetratricopeptide repeat protein [Polyangiaceae bacterium]
MLRALPLAVLTGISVGAVSVTARLARAEPPPSAAADTTSAVGAPNASPASPEAAPPTSTPRSAVPGSAVPQGSTPPPTREALEEARRHFDVALECYSRGRYRDAIAELEQARRLDPSGKDLVYNLALVHEKLGELPQALAYLRLYLEMETDPEERARTEASISRLDGAIREGQGATPDPAPRAPVAATAPAPAPLPGRLDAWVWGTGGIALCALIVGTVLGVRALSLSPGPDDATGGSRSVDDVRNEAQAAHRSAVGADVAFATAAVSGAAATLLYFGRTPLAESDIVSPSAAVPPNRVGLGRPVEAAPPRVGLDLQLAF